MCSASRSCGYKHLRTGICRWCQRRTLTRVCLCMCTCYSEEEAGQDQVELCIRTVNESSQLSGG